MGVGEGKIYRVCDIIQIVMHVFSRTKQNTLITFSRLINPVVQFWQEQNENANITSGDNACSKNLWFSSKAGTWFLVRLLNYYTIHPDKKTEFRIFEVMFLKAYIIGFWQLPCQIRNRLSPSKFSVAMRRDRGRRQTAH